MSYKSISDHIFIEAPVSIADLKRCFMVRVDVDGERKLSTDLGYITANANINPYAKYKPISSSHKRTLTEEEKKGIEKLNVVSGEFRMYGLHVWPYNSISAINLANFYKNNKNWVYDGRPTGGAESVFRLTDYDGYMHTAEEFLTTPYSKDDPVTTFNIRKSQPRFAIYVHDGDGHPEQLTFPDFTIDPFDNSGNGYPLSEGYLFVYVIQGNVAPGTWEGGFTYGPFYADESIADGGNIVLPGGFTYTEGQVYTMVAGIAFRRNSGAASIVGLPMTAHCHPAWSFKVINYIGGLTAELYAWKHYGSTKWHEYNPDPYGDNTDWWVNTEDEVAWPTSGTDAFYIGINVVNKGDTPINFTPSNRPVYVVSEVSPDFPNRKIINNFTNAKENGSSTFSIAAGETKMIYSALMYSGELVTLPAGKKIKYIIYLGNPDNGGTYIGDFTLMGNTKADK